MNCMEATAVRNSFVPKRVQKHWVKDMALLILERRVLEKSRESNDFKNKRINRKIKLVQKMVENSYIIACAYNSNNMPQKIDQKNYTIKSNI